MNEDKSIQAGERTQQITVRKQAGSRQFGIYRDGILIEGGFFSRDIAEEAATRERAVIAKAEGRQ